MVQFNKNFKEFYMKKSLSELAVGESGKVIGGVQGHARQCC